MLGRPPAWVLWGTRGDTKHPAPGKPVRPAITSRHPGPAHAPARPPSHHPNPSASPAPWACDCIHTHHPRNARPTNLSPPTPKPQPPTLNPNPTPTRPQRAARAAGPRAEQHLPGPLPRRSHRPVKGGGGRGSGALECWGKRALQGLEPTSPGPLLGRSHRPVKGGELGAPAGLGCLRTWGEGAVPGLKPTSQPPSQLKPAARPAS